MELFFYKDPQGNFGDDLNEYIWPALLSDVCHHGSDVTLIGIGSILSKSWLRELSCSGKRLVVLGSGASYDRPPEITEDWTILAVRGPLTAQLIGRPDKAVTDSGILIADVAGPHRDGKRGSKALFIPHHRSIRRSPWAEIAHAAGFQYVTPQQSVESVLKTFAEARLVVTESLHGAIVADALRIPWLPIRISPRFDPFKWLDWCLSMDVPFDPQEVAPGEASDARHFAAMSSILANAGVPLLNTKTGRPTEAEVHLYFDTRFSAEVKEALLNPVSHNLASRLYNLGRRTMNGHYRRRSVESLARLKDHPGYLSRQETFDRRLFEMREAVAALRKILSK